MIGSLLGKGLIEAVPARQVEFHPMLDDVVWRETETGERLTLIVTDAAFEALGLPTDADPASDGEGLIVWSRHSKGRGPALTRGPLLQPSRALMTSGRQLFPAEQARITRLLVSRVTVGSAGIAVDLRHHGVGSLVRDLTAPKTQEAAA